MKYIPRLFVVLAALFCSSALCCNTPFDLIPQSSEIVTGSLDNGLHYVLKSHGQPKNTLSLRMHIATGSINESEAQLGLAHFLEHLAFAGSTNFPDGSVVSTFEELGMQFGAHQNAATSFNYTIYKLELPDTSEKLVRHGLLFFADVLDRLTLDEQAIERERGIILEEKRLYDMVPGTKLAEVWNSKLLAGSLYAERLPIGTEEKILSMKKDEFIKYYRDFYRTDTTTIIMVGDMDTASMLRIIKEQFGSIASRDVVAGNSTSVSPTKTCSAYIEQGANIKSPQLAVARILPLSPPLRTIADLKQKIVDTLAQMMMRSRIELDAQISRENVNNICEFMALEVESDVLSWKEMLHETMDYLKQAQSHGFTSKELAKAKTDLITSLQTRAKMKLSSGYIADECAGLVHEGKIITSNAELLELHTRIIENVEREEINSWWQDFQLKPYMVKLSLPLSARDVPSKNKVLSAVKSAMKKKASRYKPSKPFKADDLFKDAKPTPALVASTTEYPESHITSLVLENGVRVHFKQMELPGDVVKIDVTLAGGKIEETSETHNFTLGAYKSYKVETSKFSNDNYQDIAEALDLRIFLDYDEDYLCLNGDSKEKDIETLFQLLHTVLKSPKINGTKFKRWREKKAKTLEHKVRPLEEWASLTLSELTLQPTEMRMRAPTSPASIANLERRDCNAWLARIFKEAPLAVSIVGNVDAAKITELARTYFGTLPYRPELSRATLSDKRIVAAKSGPYTASVIRPCEANASFVVAGYMTSQAGSPAVHLVDILINQRLIQRARMDERLIYSIHTDFASSEVYANHGHFLIKASCSPENQNQLADIMDEVLDTLKEAGPTDKELAAAKKIAEHSQSDMYLDEMKGNLWLSVLTDAFWRKDLEDTVKTMMQTGVEIRPNYEKVSKEDIKTLMQKIVVPENHVRIIVQGQEVLNLQ